MRRAVAVILMVTALAINPTAAEDTVTRADLTYQAYAVGLHILDVQASVSIGPWNYQVGTRYHTTGVMGFFRRGQQLATVRGAWEGAAAQPGDFVSEGVWQGEPRRALIAYDHGQPEMRVLTPPNPPDRLPVPAAAQAGSKDVLSALAELIRVAGRTGACDISARVFDGRTLSLLAARTAGIVGLGRTDRSAFAGPALRCDFTSRILAGLRTGERPDAARPLHGSIWLGRVLPGALPLPVRLTLQTRLFGEATLYLTAVRPAGGVRPRA